MSLHVTVQSEIALTEPEARRLTKEWIEVWLVASVGDKRLGVHEVSHAVRSLRSALAEFEHANSGDNGK